MVGASRQRDIKYLDANLQAVTCVKPGVASLTSPFHPGKGNGNAEPLALRRRPVRPAAGQEMRALNEGHGVRDSHVTRRHAVGAGWFPGVSGTACRESVRREPWETLGMSPTRGGNRAQWRGRHGQGVGGAHSSEEGGQCRRSEGAILPRCFLERRGPGPSSAGGLR